MATVSSTTPSPAPRCPPVTETASTTSSLSSLQTIFSCLSLNFLKSFGIFYFIKRLLLFFIIKFFITVVSIVNHTLFPLKKQKIKSIRDNLIFFSNGSFLFSKLHNLLAIFKIIKVSFLSLHD